MTYDFTWWTSVHRRHIMSRAANRTLAVVLVTVTFAGCEKSVGPPIAEPTRSIAATDPSAALMPRRIEPQETDASIDWKPTGAAYVNRGQHYVWLDASARPNHQLFVFLPSANTQEPFFGLPDNYQLLGAEAARLGYHVVVLMYPNEVRLATECPKKASPTTGPGHDEALSACYEAVRRQIIDGEGRPPYHQIAGVNVANSITNRLTKLLLYLADRYPAEGWSSYLTPVATAGVSLEWSRIAVSGHSQGGGQAVMIAKVNLVSRVVMFSSVPDSVGTTSPAWLSSHVTPSSRYYGLTHDCDGFFRSMVASWDSLGMNASIESKLAPQGRTPLNVCRTWQSTSRIAPVDPQATAFPYGGTHMFVVDVQPRTDGYVHRSSHHSTANDLFTPLESYPNGPPRLVAAWRYLLGAPTGGIVLR
jgi:hypothetical protein